MGRGLGIAEPISSPDAALNPPELGVPAVSRTATRAAVDRIGLLVGAIVLLGVALRVYHIGNQSLWLDELGEGTTATVPWNQFLSHVREGLGAEPIDYLGVRFFTTVFGRGTVQERLWALLVGSVAIYVIYRLGTRLFRDRWVGVIAAFMLTFSAFHIYYSQEGRPYALATLVAMLNLLAFLRALDSGRGRDWALYAAVCVLTFYSHYFLGLLLAIEGIYLACAKLAPYVRERRRELLREAVGQILWCAGAQVAALVLFLPWLAYDLAIPDLTYFPPLRDFTAAELYQIFVVLIGLAPLNSVPPDNLAQLVRTDVVLGLAALGLVAALATRQWRALMLVAIIGAAIAMAWWVDVLSRYFWSERQVIFVLGPLFLLAAYGVRRAVGSGWRFARSAARSIEPHRSRLMAVGGLAFVAAWIVLYSGTVRAVYDDRWITKEDWRGVSAYVQSTGCSDTRYWSILSDHFSYGIAYYYPQSFGRSHWLYGLGGGASDPSIEDAFQRSGFDSRNWFVLDASTAAMPLQSSTVDQVLRSQGWTPTAFGSILVYHRQTCGT